jgi:predicted RNase H-like nuclease (RuvC/YqgF family)
MMEKYTTNLRAEITALQARLRELRSTAAADAADMQRECEQLQVAITQLESRLCEQSHEGE